MLTKSQFVAEARAAQINKRAAEKIQRGTPPWTAHAQAAEEVDREARERYLRLAHGRRGLRGR